MHNKVKFSKILQSLAFYLVFLIFPFSVFATFGSFVSSHEQFASLADSFISGKLYFIGQPGVDFDTMDMVYHNGHYYWPLGLFPAVLLVPFRILFKTNISQGTVSFILNLFNYWLLYSLAKHFVKDKYKSTLLAFAYLFGSAYMFVSLVNWSWYYAQVVATSCILLSLYFSLVRSKYFLAGVFFGFAVLTRANILLGIGFFFLYLVALRKGRNIIVDCLKFFLPVTTGVLIFFLYNYLRFGNVLDTGYSRQIVKPIFSATRDAGVWGVVHFPNKLYTFFLKGPEVVYRPGTLIVQRMYAHPYGMSFFITSPIFLWLLLADFRKNTMNKFLLASVIPIFLFLMGSSLTGIYQVGYRHALDFQPFLYLILVSVFSERELGALVKVTTALSVFFNFYILYSNFISPILLDPALWGL